MLKVETSVKISNRASVPVGKRFLEDFKYGLHPHREDLSGLFCLTFRQEVKDNLPHGDTKRNIILTEYLKLANSIKTFVSLNTTSRFLLAKCQIWSSFVHICIFSYTFMKSIYYF